MGANDVRNAEELENCFDNKDPQEIHRYFRTFRKVSERLFNLLGKDKGVAHTDIVKCYSKRFPPKNCKGREAWLIINNCKEYLEEQIRQYRPQMIICNGSPVCRVIRSVIVPRTDYTTSYIGELDGREIVVILSGFVGRIDNHAKVRLGKEIETYMEKYGIGPSVS